MTTDVQIVNMALARLGHAPDKVTTLAGTDTTSVLANLFFGPVRDELLLIHNWRFATKRVGLVPNSTEPVFEFTYAYDLPSDYLRVVRTNLQAKGYVSGDEYRVEGSTLLSNTGPGDQKTITGATQANPVVITAVGTNFPDGSSVYIENVGGMTEINDTVFTIDNPTASTFELKGVDGSAYTAYTTGGTARILNVEIEYIYSHQTVTSWPADFVNLMVARLAAEFAPRLTDNANIAQQAWELYNRQLSIFRHAQSIVGTPRGLEADTLIQARV